jgi:hypothetical protein
VSDQSFIKQNNKTEDPSLADVLDITKTEVMLGTNCHAIGKVATFDVATQTCTVEIQYKKTQFQLQTSGPLANSYQPVAIDYPILLDVPCIVLGGKSFSLTLGPMVGATCLVLFNDRSIDNWFEAGNVMPVASPRLHSMSDGIALIGVNSLADVLADYDITRAVLRTRDGKAGVGVGTSKVKIFNDTTTMMTLLNTLITTIKAITTSNCVVGSPVVVSPASQAALDSVATQLQGLLE